MLNRSFASDNFFQPRSFGLWQIDNAPYRAIIIIYLPNTAYFFLTALSGHLMFYFDMYNFLKFLALTLPLSQLTIMLSFIEFGIRVIPDPSM